MPRKRTYVDLFNANGQGYGPVANQFLANGKLDIGNMRPYIKILTDKNTGRQAIIGAFVNLYMGGPVNKPSSYKEVPLLGTNATLRRDEWKALDDAIMEVRRYRLGGIQDLIDKGLTYNLGNAMGTTVFEWHDVGDYGEAEMTMDGITRAKNAQPNFQFNYLPIPIVHFDYEINARLLAQSRNMGNPIDTTNAERAARRVLEYLENMLFTNMTYAFGEKDDRNRNSIYSYVNHPDRITFTLGSNWDDLDFNSDTASGGAVIVNQVIDMKQDLIDNYFHGPFQLYIPSNYETVMDKDYDMTTPGTTIRERIMKIDQIKGIKVIDTLADDNILMVQMTPDVVRLIRGMDLTNIEWDSEGGMKTNYKVMTIQVPQIRSDQNGKCGVLHAA